MRLFFLIEKLLTRLVETVLALFTLAILILVIALVSARYVIQSTIIGGNEVLVILFVYCTALGSALLVRENYHIRITFFTELFPPLLQKMTRVFVDLLVVVFNISMLIYGLPWLKATSAFVIPIINIPTIVSYCALPVGTVAAALYAALDIVALVYRGKHDRARGVSANIQEAL